MYEATNALVRLLGLVIFRGTDSVEEQELVLKDVPDMLRDQFRRLQSRDDIARAMTRMVQK